MSVALVTDSTAYLPEDLRAAGGIRVVPLHVVVGGKEHYEGLDITTGDVAAALRSFTPVTTSRPSPRAFLMAYTAAAEAGAPPRLSNPISRDPSPTLPGAHPAPPQAWRWGMP